MNNWRVQGMRFAIVGLASNLILYLLYLGLTFMGLGHKTTMTLLYAMGILQTFFFNKHWSFNHDGATHTALMRYIAAYVFGYILNLVVLIVMVDHWGLPHQWVQGIMILSLAAMFFLLQKFWVFASSTDQAETREHVN